MFKLLILLILSASQILCSCPDKSLLSTCDCSEKDGITITCLHDFFNSNNLIKVFQNLEKNVWKSGKHLNRFRLSSTNIEEIYQKAFRDITFDTIEIIDCPKLKSIHEDAFHGTDKVTRTLNLKNLPALISENNSIYQIVGKFEKLQELELTNINLVEIPTSAFDGLTYLTELRLYGSSLRKIESNVFNNLENLQEIRFDLALFTNIPSDAFRISSNKYTLLIDFSNCPKVNSSAFGAGSLSNINRATRLLFGDYSHRKQITYLNENAFRPFLLDRNIGNKIELRYQDLDCNDCRNFWLKNNQDLVKGIEFLKCSDGHDLNDTAHFKQCIQNMN